MSQTTCHVSGTNPNSKNTFDDYDPANNDTKPTRLERTFIPLAEKDPTRFDTSLSDVSNLNNNADFRSRMAGAWDDLCCAQIYHSNPLKDERVLQFITDQSLHVRGIIASLHHRRIDDSTKTQSILSERQWS